MFVTVALSAVGLSLATVYLAVLMWMCCYTEDD